MNLQFKIEEFLKGALPYTDGVELYQNHGSNATLKMLFTSGEDCYSRQKLKAELQKIYENSKPQRLNDFNSYSPAKKKNSIDVVSLPPHLKTEYYRTSGLIREIAATNPTLIHLKTNLARFQSARRIVELVDQRKAIFLRCEYYLEHGRDPFEVTPKPQPLSDQNISFFEAQYRLKLARSRRSKLKGDIARHKDYERVCQEILTLEKIIQDGES